jgi:hypothetical protein
MFQTETCKIIRYIKFYAGQPFFNPQSWQICKIERFYYKVQTIGTTLANRLDM